MSPTRAAHDLDAGGAPRANAKREVGVRVVHAAVPGRTRIKVLGLYRAPSMKAQLESRLRAMDGIHWVDANPVTGNLLAHHDRELAIDALLGRICDALGARVRAETARTQIRPRRDAGIRTEGSSRQRQSPHGHRDPAPGRERAESNVSWHALEPDEVLERVQSSEQGLSRRAASERLARDGPNRLSADERRSQADMLVQQLQSVPVGLLGASAVVSALTGGVADALGIFAVIGINTVIGFVTERQSDNTIRMLGTKIPAEVPVLRDGEPAQVATEELVVGDVLELAPGGYVAADARVLAAENLSIDESALTGESMPVTKFPAAVPRPDTPLADRTAMIYMGTVVTGGNGRAVVVGTGLASEMGGIQTLASRAERPQTPVERQLAKLGTQLAIISGGACALVFAIGFIRGYGWMSMMKGAISLGAAAVPEGLPAVATTTLALGIRNMQKKKALIRRLEAVESLGSVQVACLDKTGTLTINRMSVVAMDVDGQYVTVDDGTFLADDETLSPLERATLRKILETLTLCTETDVAENGRGSGAPMSGTERALEEVAVKAGIDVAALRRRHPRLDVRHRSESRQFVATTHGISGGRPLMAVKGSPRQVLELCSRVSRNGRRRRLDERAARDILERNETMASEGLRVLGVAYASANSGTVADPKDLTWLGLVGMADPIRPGMAALLRRFRRAGIDSVMITGDQGATAYAIARQLEIAEGQSLDMLDSVSLDRMDPALLEGVLKRVRVFARVSPAHKLQIVQAMQRAGKVVAMTGDGINDGPALKAADLGIAMGGEGSDIARNIADMVLEDDNLRTVEDAIAQGRTIYQNIRKSVRFLLATNMSELSVMTLGIGLGLGQPLNPLQLLWINLITDVFPAVALGLDPPEPDVLERPPRPPDEPIVKAADFRRLGLESLVMTAGTMASYAWGRLRYGPGAEAQTQAFMSLTYNQLFHCLGCRSERLRLVEQWRDSRNDYLLAASLVSSLVQVATVLPPLRGLLGTVRPRASDFVVSLAGAAVPFLINDAIKGLATSRAHRAKRRRRRAGTANRNRRHED